MSKLIKPKTKADWLVTFSYQGSTPTAAGTSPSTSSGSSSSVLANIWSGCSGLSYSFGMGTYSDGQTKVVQKVQGPMEIADVTLTRAYDPKLHDNFVKQIEQVALTGGTLTAVCKPGRKTQDANGFTEEGKGYTIYDCTVVSFKYGETDGTSSDTSMMELVLAPGNFSIGDQPATNTNTASLQEQLQPTSSGLA